MILCMIFTMECVRCFMYGVQFNASVEWKGILRKRLNQLTNQPINLLRFTFSATAPGLHYCFPS